MDRQPLTAFSTRVQQGFSRGAQAYPRQALLQRAMAWRLAHNCLHLPLPAGPMADLGAGSGLVGQALQQQGRPLPLQQLDLCPELLAANPLAGLPGSRQWNLDVGLPADLEACGLLCSSFALQWLNNPAQQLDLWCQRLASGGWLALALPVAGSLPEWHLAAERSGVPFTGLDLPAAHDLEAVALRRLQTVRAQRLPFTRAEGDGRRFLKALRTIGAATSPQPSLGTGQLRRLLQHWPSGDAITWSVLLLIGQRR